MASEQFSVSWDNFHKIMNSGINSLLESENFVDVTLAVEGRYLKAHRMVLSVCSSYFSELFKTSPCKHPIVFMKDVSYSAMSDLLQFMYKGEVQVDEENFNTFIKTAESLQIKGLSNYGSGSADCGTESQQRRAKLMESEVAKSTVEETHQISPLPAPKRLRLDDHTTPVYEQTLEEETTAYGSDLISLKKEPYDEEESSFGIADDDSNENFIDDPLDETNSMMNENDWTMEGDEGTHAGKIGKASTSITSEKIIPFKTEEKSLADDDNNENFSVVVFNKFPNVFGIGWPISSDDIEDAAEFGTPPLLPEKSKKKYEHAFELFEQWCNENSINDITEKSLIQYFKEKSVIYKPTSLMAYYSMLRSMVLVKKNIDISRYRNLLLFLKKVSKGYNARKTLILKREQVEKFLREANDSTCLLKKVILIIGVTGACSSNELLHLRMENVIDEGNFIRVQPPSAKKNISREFLITAGNIKNVNLVEIIRKYIRLRPPETGHQRFFVCYKQGKCTKIPVGISGITSVPKNVAQFLGLANPEQYTGNCFKKTSKAIQDRLSLA